MPAGVTEAMHTPESPSHGQPPANPYAGGMHHTQASTSPRDHDSWAATLTTARGVKRSSSHGEPAARHPHPGHEPLEDAPSVRMRSISQDGGPPQAPATAPLRSAASAAAGMHAAVAHLADELPSSPPAPYASVDMHVPVGGDARGYMLQPPPTEPLRWSGQVTCGVAQLTDARAAVRTCVRAVVAAYSAIVPPAAMRRLCISNAEHIEELLHAFPTEAADMHGAEEEMHDVEGFAYHTAVTAALQFVLGELRGGMRHMAGLINVMVRHPYICMCIPPPAPGVVLCFNLVKRFQCIHDRQFVTTAQAMFTSDRTRTA